VGGRRHDPAAGPRQGCAVTLLLVIVGAAVGAPLRYLTDRAIQQRHDSDFPWGTLTVNVAGSLVLGLMTGAVAAGVSPEPLVPLVGAGLCGALTTWSAFSYETLRLAQEELTAQAAANVALSLGAGVAAAFLGALAGTAIWS